MRNLPVLFALIVILGLNFACSKTKKQPPAAPLPEVSIAVAWFNQPQTMDDLLAGIMISEQPLVGDKVLMNLDASLQGVLKEQPERTYLNIAASSAYRAKTSKVEKAGITALDYWVAVGASLNADMILVPQLTEWRDLQGSGMGADNPASVTIDFYLVDVKRAQLINRYHFEETQQHLSDNLLNIDKFVERGGQWLTAQKLAIEGMRQAVQELGL